MSADLQRTLDALPALVSTLDPSLRYETLNAQHRTWLGIDPAAAIGRVLWDVVDPAFRPVLEPLAVLALAGETVDREIELPRRHARSWVRITLTPEIDGEGRVARLHCLIIDISRERALQHRLELSQQVFNAAFDAVGVGKALVSPDGVISQVNPTFAEMLGHAPGALVGRHFAEITHPDDLDSDVAQFAALQAGRIGSYQLEKRYLARDRSVVDALLTVSVRRGAAGAPDFYIAQVVDIRDRKRAEQRVRERNAELALALEMVDGGIWQHDLAGGLVRLSGHVAARLGLPEGRRVALATLMARVHPEDRARVEAVMRGQAAPTDAASIFRMRGSGCDWLWLRWRHRLVRDGRGQPASLLGVLVDVTEEQQREERLTREAHSDPLTGLLNRRGFDLALEAAVAGDSLSALLLIDLDRFKPINDAFGHAMGDRVLCEVARRLRAAVRQRDTVARLGGDEFAALLPNIDRAAAEQAAQRIVTVLAVPCRSGTAVAQIGASVGVVLAEPGDDLRSLLRRADDTLYAVKRDGRGAWRLAA